MLGDADLWETLVVQKGGAEELMRTPAETETMLEKHDQSATNSTRPKETAARNLQKTKRFGNSWRKLSNVGRPRLVSSFHELKHSPSVQSDTSSDDDSSGSSVDERTAPTHASTVTEENTSTIQVSRLQGGSCCSTTANQDTAPRTKEDEQDERYSESLDGYKQSVAMSMEAGSLWSTWFDESQNEGPGFPVPKESTSAESAFMDSFSIRFDEFQKQDMATSNIEESSEAADSPSDECNTTHNDTLPEVSIFVETYPSPAKADRIGIQTAETKDTAFSTTDSIWDDVEIRPMEEEEWKSIDQGSKTSTAVAKRGLQRVASAKDMARRSPVEDVVPETQVADVEVAVDAPQSSPIRWLRDQRKRVEEARVAKQRVRTATRSMANAIQRAPTPRPSGNVRIVSDFDYHLMLHLIVLILV